NPTLALPAIAHRRPARVLRTPSQAPPPRSLAVDGIAQSRVRETQHAARRDRLSTAAGDTHPHSRQPGQRPRSLLPETGRTRAGVPAATKTDPSPPRAPHLTARAHARRQPGVTSSRLPHNPG